MSKRPLGLSKSKGKASAAPTSKKQKIAHEAEDSQSLEDDWEDLQELFARANTAFIRGGTYCISNPPSSSPAHPNNLDLLGALPLLRGVVHECDRIQRNAGEEELKKLAALESSHAGRTNSHSSFFSLYADALLHMGLIIGHEPELIVEGEPDSAESYFEAAKTLLDERWPNKQQIDDVRLQFTWANVLLLLANVVVSTADEDNSEVDVEIPELIEDALLRYSISAKLAGPLGPVPGCSSATPAQPTEPSGEEGPAFLPQLTLARIHGGIGSRLWQVVERLSPSLRKRWSKSLWDTFTFAIEKSHSPDEDDALCAGLIGRGAINLAKISDMLPEVVDSQNAGHGVGNQCDIDAEATRTALDKCKSSLASGLHLTDRETYSSLRYKGL